MPLIQMNMFACDLELLMQIFKILYGDVDFKEPLFCALNF